MIRLLLTLSFCALATVAWSQGDPDYDNGMNLELNEDGTSFIRFITWHQIWTRSVSNNPGTTVNGLPEDHSVDLGLRRSRFLAFSQINNKFLILTHWGINNQSFTNGGAVPGSAKKPQLFLHDLWGEFAVLPTQEDRAFSLYVGAGLNYWQGSSRMSNASTLNFLALDAPIFTWHNFDRKDQFARQLGWYAKGKWDQLEYRLAVTKPFNHFSDPISQTVSIEAPTNNFATGGYVEYQFLESEANVLPYKVGSYLGSKRVFNMGLGWYHHADGTWTEADTGVDHPIAGVPVDFHDITVLSADVFADLPLGRGWALTAYSMYSYADFGPNYTRFAGILNIADASPSPTFTGQQALSGFGNTEVLFGSGHFTFTEAGVLLPANAVPGPGRWQPYVVHTYKGLDALNQAGHFFDVGLNYLIQGHHAKLTLNYGTRPLFDTQGGVFDHRGELVLQTHVYL